MKNYNELAANWWTEKIQQTQPKNRPIDVVTLDLFKKELAFKLKTLTSVNPSLIISTCGTKSKLLLEVASNSGLLNLQIPSGYEMRILFDDIWVFNSNGKMIASF